MSCFSTIFGAFIRFYSDSSVSLCDKNKIICVYLRKSACWSEAEIPLSGPSEI